MYIPPASSTSSRRLYNEVRPEDSSDQVKLIEPLNNAILRRQFTV